MRCKFLHEANALWNDQMIRGEAETWPMGMMGRTCSKGNLGRDIIGCLCGTGHRVTGSGSVAIIYVGYRT
jgi:hypothetical protein